MKAENLFESTMQDGEREVTDTGIVTSARADGAEWQFNHACSVRSCGGESANMECDR